MTKVESPKNVKKVDEEIQKKRMFNALAIRLRKR